MCIPKPKDLIHIVCALLKKNMSKKIVFKIIEMPRLSLKWNPPIQ